MFEDNLAKARHFIRLASKEHGQHEHQTMSSAERIDYLVVALHELVHAMEVQHLHYRIREPD